MLKFTAGELQKLKEVLNGPSVADPVAAVIYEKVVAELQRIQKGK